MNNLEFIGCLKNGSSIHIKEKNKGKFTASAKKAGESVLEHATHVLNNPNATTLLKKRAQFAKNAKHFKHEDGARIHKPFGHNLDKVVGNGWMADNTKEIKKRSGVSIKLAGGRVKRVNWDTLAKDPEYLSRYNWKIIPKNMRVIEDSLINRRAKDALRVAVFSLVIPESGGSTKPHGNGAFGLIGWRGVRAKNLPNSLPKLTHVLMEGLFDF